MFKIKNLKIEAQDLPKQLLCLEVNELLLPSTNISLCLEEPQNLTLIDNILKDPKRFVAILVKSTKTQKTSIGCLGKIRSFIETEDARYLINIDGICRFNIVDFLNLKKGQKLLKPDWTEFLQDLKISQQKIKGRLQLNYVTNDYFSIVKNEKKLKSANIKNIKDLELINLLAQNLTKQIMNQGEILRAKDINELSALYKGFMELKIAEQESRKSLKH